MKMLRCPKCFSEISEITRKCQYCSAVVCLSEDKTRFFLNELVCVRCSFKNKGGVRYCGMCGFRLTKICTQCGFEGLIDLPVCGRCKTAFYEVREKATPLDTWESEISQESSCEAFQGKKVLVVDDEPFIAKLVKITLEMEGIEVLQAGNVDEALEVAAKEKPAVIITDVMMPEKNGYDLLREVKKNPETRDIRVIILTVLSDLEEIRRGIIAGAEDHVVKPFDPEHLTWSVKRALGKYHPFMSGDGELQELSLN